MCNIIYQIYQLFQCCAYILMRITWTKLVHWLYQLSVHLFRSPRSIRLTSGISIPSPPIRGFQSFRHPSATILIHGPPSAFSSSCSSTRHKGSSGSSVGGSSKSNSSRSNVSILAAFAATAWQPHGAYRGRPGPCICKR